MNISKAVSYLALSTLLLVAYLLIWGTGGKQFFSILSIYSLTVIWVIIYAVSRLGGK
jgi:hypothetical protein